MTLGRTAYHRLDIRMWNGIELGVFKFILRADVDECAFVLCTITVFGCRKD